MADLAILVVDDLGADPLPLGDAGDHTVGALLGWDDAPAPSPFRIDRPVTVRIEAVGSDQRIERPSWLVAGEIDKGDSGGRAGGQRRSGGRHRLRDESQSRRGRLRGQGASELDDLLAEGFDDNLIVPGC